MDGDISEIVLNSEVISMFWKKIHPTWRVIAALHAGQLPTWRMIAALHAGQLPCLWAI